MRSGKLLLSALGLMCSVIPPLLAVITYFPIWTDKGGSAVLSGTAILLLLICFLPLYKLLGNYLRSPSAPVVWLVVFLAFFALAEIADEMKVIAFWGFIGNLIGTFLFRIARKLGGKSDEEHV